MGLIKAVKDYDDTMEILIDSLDKLGESLYTAPDSKEIRKLIAQYGVVRQHLEWLINSKEILFGCIDKALEDR